MGSTDVVPLVLLFIKPHANAFFSSCLAPSELLCIILRPLACRPIDMLLACLRTLSPCLPPHGAMEDYDLHWTDTPGHNLDHCEPGAEEEWFAFCRTQLRRKGKNGRRKKSLFCLHRTGGFEASISDGGLRTPRSLWRRRLAGDSGRCLLNQLPVDRFRQKIQQIPKGSAVITIPRFLWRLVPTCCIAVGVPRIAAARALADRVAEEAGEKVGNSVGLFTDEGKTHSTMRQSLSFATLGSLLRRVRHSISRDSRFLCCVG